MVWLFQTRHADSVSKPRSFRSATAARRSAQAGQAARLRTMQSRSPAMAQRLLRNTRTVHLLHSPRTTNPTCAESHPPYRQINALAKKLALHFWYGVKIRRCVRELASVARRGAFALAGRYRDD